MRKKTAFVTPQKPRPDEHDIPPSPSPFSIKSKATPYRPDIMQGNGDGRHIFEYYEALLESVGTIYYALAPLPSNQEIALNDVTDFIAQVPRVLNPMKVLFQKISPSDQLETQTQSFYQSLVDNLKKITPLPHAKSTVDPPSLPLATVIAPDLFAVTRYLQFGIGCLKQFKQQGLLQNQDLCDLKSSLAHLLPPTIGLHQAFQMHYWCGPQKEDMLRKLTQLSKDPAFNQLAPVVDNMRNNPKDFEDAFDQEILYLKRDLELLLKTLQTNPIRKLSI